MVTTTATGVGPPDAKHELVMERVFDAPREAVFAAWTRPGAIQQWWGPRGFTLPVCDFDVREGEAYRCVMRSPEGKDYGLSGAWREVTPPHRLVFTFVWDGDHEGIAGVETVVTCAFTDAGDGKTAFRLHQAPLASAESAESHRDGWTQTFDRLNDLLREASS